MKYSKGTIRGNSWMEYIYALCRGEKVIYVGRSINVEKRIKAHTSKGFDSYKILARCDKKQSRKFEDAYIKMFNPEHNKQLNAHGWYMSIEDFCANGRHKDLLLLSIEKQGFKPLFANNYRGCDLHFAQQYIHEVI